MGAEIFLHFSVDAPHVATEDVKEAVETDDGVALEPQTASGTPFIARVGRESRAREGDRIEVAVDTRMLHFFDLETGAAIARVGFQMATIETNPQLGAQIKADAKEFVLHSWSVQNAIDPIPVAGAEGRHFWDYDGKRYLDFASQLVNVSIGYGHPKLIAAIKEQAEKLCTIGPPMATEPRSQLGRMLADVTPGNLKMSFFTNGGAEANENAIKVARWVTGRHKVIARYRSYHGATGGAITLTGDPRRWHAEPGPAGHRAHARPVHLSLPGRASRSVPRLHRRAAPRGDPPVRGRAHGRRGDPRDRRRHERRSSSRPTAISSRSARRATSTESC